MPLSRHSVGTYPETSNWPQSSQLAELLWTDHGMKRGIGMRELISTSNKQINK